MTVEARTAYLGYPIVVREGSLTILDRSGRVLFSGRMELSGAFRFIRAHRRAS